jgi:hypothetical protein
MSRRVPFSLVVVLDDDGAIRGCEMTCEMCGEIGWKGPADLWAHAATHPNPWEVVTVSRSLMDELERQAGLYE